MLISLVQHPRANIGLLDAIEQRHDLLYGDVVAALIVRRDELLAAQTQTVNVTNAPPAYGAPQLLEQLGTALPPPSYYSSR